MSWPVHIVNASGIVINKKDEILMVHLEHRGWEHPGRLAFTKMQHYLSDNSLVFTECHTKDTPLKIISQSYLI